MDSAAQLSLANYQAPIDDLLFSLTQISGVERLPNWDASVAPEILNHASKFVENIIAPAEPTLDIEGTRIEDGRVKTPAALKEIMQHFIEGGWHSLCLPEEWDGQAQPHALNQILFEMVAGASLNASVHLICPAAALKLIISEGSDAQKSRYIPGILSGEYSATIVLSEAQAGSDLRLIRTIAKPNAEPNAKPKDGQNSWSLSGGKVFCTNGDHDVTPNIVHCVLARTPDAPEGTRGLSLFLCPAVLPDGTRNTVSVDRVEEKMGLHGSPTCQMNFDGAEAELVGEVGEGLTRMFTMMNAMRMDVAMQGVGLCQVAFQRSQAYAATRLQGRSARADGTNETVTIDQHGDVKRMLMLQEALAIGCRGMVLRTAVELEIDQHSKLADIMMPVCKVFASDAASEAADLAIQIHGGYGYVREYQVEQIARDSRITRIYEGANGLHATNLALGLSRPKGSSSADAFAGDIKSLIADADTAMKKSLEDVFAHWQEARSAITSSADCGIFAYDFMRLTGFTAFAAVWSKVEQAADVSTDPDKLRSLAEFVRSYMLPETEILARRIGGLKGES